MEELQATLKDCGLAIVTVPEKGRGLFNRGDEIVRQEPYVCVSNCIGERCNICFDWTDQKCSKCRVLHYCSSTCQKLDWVMHRLECRAISNLQRDELSWLNDPDQGPPVLLGIRLLIRSKLESDEKIPVCAMNNYSLVQALKSDLSVIDENKTKAYEKMADLVRTFLKWPDINEKDVAENFSKIALNNHTVFDSQLRDLGVGLYPVISFINHSCLPNCIVTFEGRQAVARAVQHIPKDTEVLTTYIDLAQSTSTRQMELKEKYFFTCKCPRCGKQDQDDDAKLEAYRCIDDKCDGILLSFPGESELICQKCRIPRSNEEIQEIEVEIKSLQQKALEARQSLNFHELIGIYLEIEKNQRKLYTPDCIDFALTWDAISQISLKLDSQKVWREGLRCCKLTIALYEKVLPDYHPLLGLHYNTCGKLEWLLEEGETAISTLTKAIEILEISHGSTTFVKSVQSQLKRLQKTENDINST